MTHHVFVKESQTFTRLFGGNEYAARQRKKTVRTTEELAFWLTDVYLFGIRLTEEKKMAKKQAQFRFDEDFYGAISALAEKEGMTISEIVRDAIRLYIALYERTKGENAKLFLEYGDSNKPKCEVVLPWIQLK